MNKILYFLVYMLVHISILTYTQGNIITAQYAGSWYPEKNSTLTKTLQSLMQQAKQQFEMHMDSNQIRALIVPHAAYKYSGTVAAAAYQLLIKNTTCERIIIIGPLHRGSLANVVVPSSSHYKIPSGILKIDTQGIETLLATSVLYQQSDEPFLHEHSVEIQLPFIRYCLPKTPILPILVGNISEHNIQTIAHSLKKVVTPNTIVIISSDFIHHGEQYNYVPFTKNILLHIRQLDSALLNTIQKNQIEKFSKTITQTGATICGVIPIKILLTMIKQETFGTNTLTRLIAYSDSTVVSNTLDAIVTYSSLLVTTERNMDEIKSINQQEKRSLLQYARDTLLQSFNKNIDHTLLLPLLTPLLEQSYGVFVTLYIKKGSAKQLRGCIGTVVPSKPLYATVADMTLASAFDDKRFEPLTKKEFDTISIEISVLTKPHPIKSYHEIILNKNGIILSHKQSSALFLPKVPQEHGFDLTQTLNELSKKAGLEENIWKSKDTQFEVFETIDFSE